MTYTPPDGDNINVSFSGAYTPPDGDNIVIDLSESPIVYVYFTTSWLEAYSLDRLEYTVSFTEPYISVEPVLAAYREPWYTISDYLVADYDEPMSYALLSSWREAYRSTPQHLAFWREFYTAAPEYIRSFNEPYISAAEVMAIWREEWDEEPDTLASWQEPYLSAKDFIRFFVESYITTPEHIAAWREPYIAVPEHIRSFTERYTIQFDVDASISVLHQLWHLVEHVVSVLPQTYHITELNAISVLEQFYDVSGMNLALSTLPQTWSLISSNLVSDDPTISTQQDIIVDLINSGATQGEIEIAINDLNSLLPTANSVSYAIFINEVQVFSENINVECNDETYYIKGTVTIENPAYFPLCVKNAPVRIEIVTPNDSKTYNLLIAGKSTRQTTNSITYDLECKSRTYLLDSKFVPTLQREFSESLASEIVVEMAALAGVNVIWNIYQDGVLVDQTIPSGFLFANNEKPLAVIRKITEAIGAIIQTTPEGDMEIIHSYPVKVPDYETYTPDHVLDSSIRFESISTSYEEKLGVNTVNVSDQLTSDSSFTLEQEEISNTEKIIKGFHVPFGTEDVFLDTSGGTTIFIEYLGIEELLVTGPNDEDLFELIEFKGGTGNTSKPIYSINSINWVEDVLGAVTSAEDGTLTSEILGESLLEITYTTKYYKWRVTSPELRHVQFILRPVNG